MRRSVAVNALPDYPLKRSRSSQLLLLLSSNVLRLWAQWWIMPRCMKTTSLIAVNQMSCLVVRRAKKIFPRWNVFFSLDDPVLCLTRTLILWPLASRQLCLVCPLNLSVCIGTIVLKNSNVKKIFCMYDSYVDLRCWKSPFERWKKQLIWNL